MRKITVARSLVTLGLGAAIACGPNKNTKPDVPDPLGNPDAMPVALDDVPAQIDTTSIGPDDGSSPADKSPLLDIMLAENQRWMKELIDANDPAYYLAYQITDARVVSMEAEGGALIADQDETDRNLDVEIRVGTPALDNTRRLSDETAILNEPVNRHGIVPFGHDEEAITHHLWLETDRRYREAAKQLAYVQQDVSTLSKSTDVPDFVPATAEIFIGKPAKLSFDKAAWIDRLKRCSARALRGKATRGSCSVLFQEVTVYFVNSEGSQIQQSWTHAQLAVSVGVKADDGMGLGRLEQRFGRTPDDLPDDTAVDEMITTVATDLDALHGAPLAEPYVGPAILEGRAAGVFFHEVFGHRIEGHRQKDQTEGKTFASYVGKEIMPDWLSVHDDPTLTTLNGVQLNGFYRFDDEGVRAQSTPLVERGQLVGFLLGRNPVEGFAASNGHGRRQPTLPPVSRQGNLVVSASKTVPRAELEAVLIEEIKRQKRPYGMIFTDISGGFTLTTAFAPQSFKVEPVMAYRLYPDGKRELVRGVDIVGTPLVALQSIRAASREVETFNGVCGAESGWVPVSASAPSLLIERLETEKSYIPPDRPPVLDPPSITTGGAP
jgi:predicted Zn-dependent protease